LRLYDECSRQDRIKSEKPLSHQDISTFHTPIRFTA
jgi:hypothetical protein